MINTIKLARCLAAGIVLAMLQASAAEVEINDRDSRLRLDLRTEACSDGTRIECAFICDRGAMKLDNAMFDHRRICDTRIWINSPDGTVVEKLCDLSLASKFDSAPAHWLFEGGISGRRFVVKLPPGKYTVFAEYSGLVWSEHERRRTRQVALATQREFRVEERKREVDSSLTLPRDETKPPLEVSIKIHQPRLTAGEWLVWTVNIANTTDRDVWCYNPTMVENLEPRCATLVLTSERYGELWDIFWARERSVRRERVTDWLVLPPGGFLQFVSKRRVQQFTVERAGHEGVKFSPHGKYALELRCHAAMIGRPPRNIPSWDKFPERMDETLTWDQWREAAPGAVIFRSKKAEFEVVME